MTRRTSRKSAFQMPKVAQHRKSFDERTGRNTRAATVTAKALTEAVVLQWDDDGHLIREWKPEEYQRYSNDDIKRALTGKQVVEPEDMLEFVPPPAIKYCVTKGWLVKAELGGFYHVTRKAAAEFQLPKTFRGRTIRFLDRGL